MRLSKEIQIFPILTRKDKYCHIWGKDTYCRVFKVVYDTSYNEIGGNYCWTPSALVPCYEIK